MTLEEVGIYGLIAATGFLWVRFNHRTLNDAFSPLNLLLFFWVLPYLGSLLKLSGFQQGLTFEGHALVLSATLGMMFPSLATAYVLSRSRLTFSLDRFQVSPLQHSVGRRLAIVFLIATVLAYLQAVFVGQGIPLAEYAAGTATAANLHQAGMRSKLQILAFAVHIAGAMVLYLGLTSRHSWTRFGFFALAAVPPILGILRALKGDVFMSLLYYAAVVYYYRRSRNLRLPMVRTLVVGILLVSALALITTLRSTGQGNPAFYSQLIAFKYSGLPFPLNEILGVVYGYTSLTFENFARFLEYGDHQLRLGTSMFRPLFSVFMQGRIPDSMLAGVDWHYVAPFANAPNGLTELYAEGGPLLSIIGPLVYGLVVNLIYLRFRRSGSTTWLFVYINFLFPWVWMFFTNAFSVLGFYANAFYVVAIAACAEWTVRWVRVTRGQAVTRVAAPQTS
jgi:hypothetical protein